MNDKEWRKVTVGGGHIEILALNSIIDEVNWDKSVRVGNFTLHPANPYPDGSPSVWIQQVDGEGGQFPALSLEKVIKEFYDKNF